MSKPAGPPPTSTEVAQRVLALRVVIAYSAACPPRAELATRQAQWPVNEQRNFFEAAIQRRDQFRQRLREMGLAQFLTPKEIQILDSTIATMTDRQQIDAGWRVESAQVLMWALNLLLAIPSMDNIASKAILKLIPADSALFISQAELRPAEEIRQARDVAELWHWRSRTRQLMERGDKFPEASMRDGIQSFEDIIRVAAEKAAEDGVIPEPIDDDFPVRGVAYRDLSKKDWSRVRSISVERHFALNWLCGYAPPNRWDLTPTGT
jgi:hypothetical protein